MTTTETAGALTYQIDPAHSRVHFAIRHLMIAYIRGEFQHVTGTVTYHPGDLAQLSVEATIDANTFHSGNEQRDAHVKGEHFLNVAAFPTITFVSKHATASEAGAQIVGDLTLHGVTHEVTLLATNISEEVNDPWGNRRLGVTASARIDRASFGIDFNIPMDNGGVALSNELDITLDLQLTRKPE